MKRWIVGALLLCVVAGAGVLLTGWMIVHPVQMAVGKAPVDLHAQDVAFPSESGSTIHGWWCPIVRSRGAVLLLPGIRANRLSMVARARFLRAAGYSTLLIDLQATGESRGDRITLGAKESRDVLAAVAFIRREDPSSPIAIIGSSLGGAAALLAMPPLRVDALILESVYPTIDQALDNRMRKYLGALGRLLAPILRAQLQPRLHISPNELRPIDHIARAECPVLIMGGVRDRNTTADETRELFARARAPKELWLLPKAGHVDLHRKAAQEYERRVLQFLRRSFQNAKASAARDDKMRESRIVIASRRNHDEEDFWRELNAVGSVGVDAGSGREGGDASGRFDGSGV